MRNQGYLFVDTENGKVYRCMEICDNKWGCCYDAVNNLTYLMRVGEWDYEHLNEWQKHTMEENKQMCGYHMIFPTGEMSKDKFHENVDEYRWYSGKKVAFKVGTPSDSEKKFTQFDYYKDGVEDINVDILKWFVFTVFGLDESVERNQFSTVEEFIEKIKYPYGK